jgi:hypothetical protein
MSKLFGTNVLMPNIGNDQYKVTKHRRRPKKMTQIYSHSCKQNAPKTQWKIFADR